MASYKEAIKWIANNDDVTDIDFAPTPTMSLVADLFRKSDEKVLADVKRAVENL